MIVAKMHSFNGGMDYMMNNHKELFSEISNVINSTDSTQCKIKISKEKTTTGKMLYCPSTINKSFKQCFTKCGWQYEVPLPGKKGKGKGKSIDFFKGTVGVEVQFGKYAFLTYDMFKFARFYKRNIIECAIEIVPVAIFAKDMSTGVSKYEDLVEILQDLNTDSCDIFPPMVVIGISG